MTKKKAIETIKNLEGDYDIELKFRPCCCKKAMDKVFDACNGGYFWLCRTCGNIREETK